MMGRVGENLLSIPGNYVHIESSKSYAESLNIEIGLQKNVCQKYVHNLKTCNGTSPIN